MCRAVPGCYVDAQEAAESQAEAERHERLAQEYSAKKAVKDNK
jgi:hypothetical protein